MDQEDQNDQEDQEDGESLNMPKLPNEQAAQARTSTTRGQGMEWATVDSASDDDTSIDGCSSASTRLSSRREGGSVSAPGYDFLSAI